MFALVLLTYLVIGMFISRAWYRRQRRKDDDDKIAAGFIVLFWPVYEIGKYTTRFVRWFYGTPFRGKK